MNSNELACFIVGWRGYLLGQRHEWYPHQRVEGVRAGWLVASAVHQVGQFKRVAHLLEGLFAGGATLWLYGVAHINMGERPRRESDYQDLPHAFSWGRSWGLWWSGQLSNSVYIRWRRSRMHLWSTKLGRSYAYRRGGRRRRRARRPRLVRRWVRLRRRGCLPRGCYRAAPVGAALAGWWRRRVTRPGWNHPFDSTPLYRRRWGGSPVVGPRGLTPGWVTRWATRVVQHHRRRRGWSPAGGVYRWGRPTRWVRPTVGVARPARRYRRRGARVGREVRRFQRWPSFFPGVVATTATGVTSVLMGEAHAVGLPTVLWATGVAPGLTPWAVGWPLARLDGLTQWISLVWGGSRGVALVRGIGHRLSVGTPFPG